MDPSHVNFLDLDFSYASNICATDRAFLETPALYGEVEAMSALFIFFGFFCSILAARILVHAQQGMTTMVFGRFLHSSVFGMMYIVTRQLVSYMTKTKIDL